MNDCAPFYIALSKTGQTCGRKGQMKKLKITKKGRAVSLKPQESCHISVVRLTGPKQARLRQSRRLKQGIAGLCLLLALSAKTALAAGGAAADRIAADRIAADGLPLKTLLIQLMNFTPFVLILFFLLKKPVSHFFSERRRDFLKMQNQALEEEKQARAEYKKQKALLEEQTEREKTAKAFALKEGERFRQKKARELQETEAAFEREKQFFVRLEEEKAHADLLKTLTRAIACEAKKRLKTSAREDAGFQEKIRQDFLGKLRLNKF